MVVGFSSASSRSSCLSNSAIDAEEPSLWKKEQEPFQELLLRFPPPSSWGKRQTKSRLFQAPEGNLL